jgi:hypothetical protein
MQYYFSIGTIFKNESHIMKEWLEHYFFHGIEHIYMIDDHSNDNYLEILQPYIDSGRVTLFHSEEPYYLGRQRNLYNRIFMPELVKTFWFGIFDMDEFLFSVRDIDIRNVLKNCESIGQIQFSHTLFGSNGIIQQPKYVIPNFTKRHIQDNNCNILYKYIINTNYEFSMLNVHHATFKNLENEKNGKFLLLDYRADLENPWFTLNHYNCQSEEFWKNVKCQRGDVDDYAKRDMEIFNLYNTNDVEDLRLLEQNKSLYETLLL